MNPCPDEVCYHFIDTPVLITLITIRKHCNMFHYTHILMSSVLVWTEKTNPGVLFCTVQLSTLILIVTDERERDNSLISIANVKADNEKRRPRRISAMNSLYYHSSLQLSSFKLAKQAATVSVSPAIVMMHEIRYILSTDSMTLSLCCFRLKEEPVRRIYGRLIVNLK